MQMETDQKSPSGSNNIRIMDQKECIFNFTSKYFLGKKGKYVYFVAETYQPPNQNVSLL